MHTTEGIRKSTQQMVKRGNSLTCDGAGTPTCLDGLPPLNDGNRPW